MYLLRLSVREVLGKGNYVQGKGYGVQGTGALEQLYTKLRLELLNKQTSKDTPFGGSAASSQ